MDSIPLVDLMAALRASENHLVHGIVIVRHGKLVFEAYFPGLTHPTYGEQPITYDRDTKHCLSSVAKSVTATLLGLAIDHGFIPSADARMFDYFPDYADLDTGARSRITLRHLVTMSAGLEWDEESYPLGDIRNDLTAWFRHDGDLVRFVLERPMVAEPGVLFIYSGGATNVLARAIERGTGMRLDTFSEEYLFAPLGITDFSWYFLRPEFVYASGDVSLRPRDMAKVGQLYLQDGMWRGDRILSSDWVARSQAPEFQMPAWMRSYWGHTGYTHGWWTKTLEYGTGAYSASGWGEQRIIVMPAYDMVVAITGGSYWQEPPISAHRIMTDHILEAVQR
jgi:CubicO group peptidase (beta-lactamase class C family)